MLIEIILIIFLGILSGTVTGLIPGIHINLIGALLITLTASLYFNPTYAIVFITAMAITHTFIDFIPSIFLGCPDTDTEMSVLPGHELLKSKRGYEAIYLSNKGSLIAIFILLTISIPSIFIIKTIYPLLQKIIPYLLIMILIILILTEKNKINSIIAILLTGFLGFSINTIEMSQPLLPLLTGLFGASNIILSIRNNTIIPDQMITIPNVSAKQPIYAALISAPLCSLLPGMGSGQAAIIGNLFIKNSRKQFLILTGIINTLVMAFSFITLYTINKTRTGAAASIKEIFPELALSHLVLILFVIFISGIVAYKLTDILARLASINFGKINYKLLSTITLIILVTITILISGFMGLIVLTISTLTGIYCIKLKVKRTNMMAVLILPTIFWLI